MATTKMLAPAGSASTVISTEYGRYAVASDGTVTVDSRAVPALQRAGYIVDDNDFSGGIVCKSGRHTVTAGEDTANTCSIVTGLAAVTAFFLMIRRSGVVVSNVATVSESAGTITVADNSSSYVLTSGDVIDWIATGTV